jgi:hypothetical protein
MTQVRQELFLGQNRTAVRLWDRGLFATRIVHLKRAGVCPENTTESNVHMEN